MRCSNWAISLVKGQYSYSFCFFHSRISLFSAFLNFSYSFFTHLCFFSSLRLLHCTFLHLLCFIFSCIVLLILFNLCAIALSLSISTMILSYLFIRPLCRNININISRSFGVVHKAEYGGKTIAIKLIEVEEGETEALTNELKILKV